MNYDAIFQRAREVATQRLRSGEAISPDDTVCVICSGTERLYVGINRMENNGGSVRMIHAEADAMRNMQAMGDSIVQKLLLLSVVNGMPLLPCDDCMRMILSLHTENIRCEIMMHDRAVPIAEFSEKLKAYNAARNGLTPDIRTVTSVSVPAPPETGSTSNLLKSRVDSLLNVGDDEDEVEEETKKKGLFGGLFKKK